MPFLINFSIYNRKFYKFGNLNILYIDFSSSSFIYYQPFNLITYSLVNAYITSPWAKILFHFLETNNFLSLKFINDNIIFSDHHSVMHHIHCGSQLDFYTAAKTHNQSDTLPNVNLRKVTLSFLDQLKKNMQFFRIKYFYSGKLP